MKTDNPDMDGLLTNFPAKQQRPLRQMFQRGGRLAARQLETLGVNTEADTQIFMRNLLPLARFFAHAPISGMRVGAVALGRRQGRREIYLGANMEFVGLALNQTIHAEQAVLINAWQHGATKLEALAVTAPPCGHCRQFLMEVGGSQALGIILPSDDGAGYQSMSLESLLPRAFGPRDLGQRAGLMAAGAPSGALFLPKDVEDPLVQRALDAAARSWAPYSGNRAGCCLEDGRGRVYTGCAIESAAYNPGVTALHSAWLRLWFDNPQAHAHIARAVMVEAGSLVSQKSAAQQLLAILAPKVHLVYHRLPAGP
jgi:cytidine deaminase